MTRFFCAEHLSPFGGKLRLFIRALLCLARVCGRFLCANSGSGNYRSKKMKQRFTLIELLVVVLIIGILAAVRELL